MPHERHRVGVEIQIAFVSNQSGVVRGRKDKRLCTLIIRGDHLLAGHAKRLRLAV